MDRYEIYQFRDGISSFEPTDERWIRMIPIIDIYKCYEVRFNGREIGTFLRYYFFFNK